MLSWWIELPWWLRYGVAFALLGLSTLIFFVWNRLWPWGWGVGLVLLMFSGRSESQKKGYRF